MSTTPKQFGFIRATLALWATNVGAFIRAGIVSDSPNGGNAWGINIPGTGWIYAAMRGAAESFSSVTLTDGTANNLVRLDGTKKTVASCFGDDGTNATCTRPLTLNGATRPAWGGALSGSIQLSNAGSIASPSSSYGVQLGSNEYHDGLVRRATQSATGTNFPTLLVVSNGVLNFSASQTDPVADGIISDMTSRWSVDRFGQQKQFTTEPVTSGTSSRTAAITAGNTTTETSLWGGALTVAANRIQAAGQVIHVKAAGYFSGLNAAAFTVRLKIGATVFTTSDTLPSAITGSAVRIEGDLTFSAVGASGLVWGYIILHFAATIGKTQPYVIPVFVSTSGTAWDTTASKTLDLTWQWGAASASNTITIIPGPSLATT
jgi:hypothetical protein